MRLLHTKFNKPPMYTKYIERREIHHLLTDYKNHKLILVSAPAGSGKSTVMNAWLDAINVDFSWYNLDSSDNDIQQFFAYLIAALECHQIMKSYDLSKLAESMQAVGTMNFMQSIIHVLHDAQLPFILVLDDYHLIHNKEIHNAVNILLEHLPSFVHLVIITREDPPFALSKLRVRRQMLEIRVNQLHFDEGETKRFMFDAMQVDIPLGQISALTQKTEGWIAGLQLAALSLQNTEDPNQFLNEITDNHYIVDYFLEEVLNHMDRETTTFLIDTSILSQFTPELCDFVLEAKTGSSMAYITKLSQINAFLIPLDHKRKWFRYHHLFRDLLLQRLPITSTDINKLHNRASVWFSKHNHIDLAIHHAFEASSVELAADLIENLWVECDRSLQATRWLNHFNRLPKDIVEKRPVLLLGYAWALLDISNHLEAEIWLKKAQDLYDAIQAGQEENYSVSDDEQYLLFPSTIASAYCYIAIGHGRFDEMFTYAKKAFSESSNLNPHRNSVLRMLMGLAYWAVGNLPMARKEISQAMTDIKRIESPITIGTYEIVTLELLMDTGQYELARDMLNRAIETQLKETKLPLALANFHLVYSRLHLAKGDIEEAIASHKTSKSYGLKHCLPDFWYKWYQQQATLQLHQGLYDSALASLDEADRHYYLNPLPTRTTLNGLRGHLYTLLDRFDDAAICFENLYAEQDKIYESIYLAKKGGYLSARQNLLPLLESAQSQGRLRSATEFLVGLAVLEHYEDNAVQCLDSLNEAMTFINEHDYIEPLLRYQDILTDVYPKLKLSDDIKEKMSINTTDTSYSIFKANQELPEPLTPRELEIIQLLSNGYSNQDICDELFLALSTVKGYNQNLFGKLGVRRRTEAISKARSLNLID